METFGEIGRDDWPAYLAGFSRRHRGWLVSLWVIRGSGPGADVPDGAEILVRDRPLWDIVTERHDANTDLVVMTRDADAHTHGAHPVRGVASIVAERDRDGGDVALLVTTADRQVTLLSLRVPGSSTGDLDGLAPQEMP